jgi:hypothetical protein
MTQVFHVIAGPDRYAVELADAHLIAPRNPLAALAATRKGTRQVEAYAALIRGALVEAKPAQTKVRRFNPGRLRLPAIAPAVRAEYAAALRQCTAAYVAQGKLTAEAQALALDDLGCLEFFDFMREQRERLAEPPISQVVIAHDGEGVQAA